MRQDVYNGWIRGMPRGRAELARPTLLVLLAAIAAPALMVALAFGWRPVDPAVFAPVEKAVAALRPAANASPRAEAADWPTADGWFYTQLGSASGQPMDRLGFAVSDRDGKPFWSEFQRLGGTTLLGYPLSGRFDRDGATYQVFQRAVLTYHADSGTIRVVPILDQLHAAGFDDSLLANSRIPTLALPPPAGVESAGERTDWLLAEYPAMQAYLAAAPDARALLGLPTSTVQDFGAYYAVRFQNGALQQWKVDMPWARKGDVTAVNVGEIAARLGLFPADALIPTAAEAPAGSARG